ncbi:MAG: hypothetical protein A3F68_11945 [Acidobacteria bacterium RIFCSPLOWO2_12_FULL_54_10]|nr:MAG: hypothetical protein A3F68_11945 [Acidobacteria bacterium RIFCSPLOWO2_12_FULL_54_10]
MTGRTRTAIVSFSTVLALLVVLGAVLGQENKPGSSEPYRPLAVMSEVLARIQNDYVEAPDFDNVTKGALQGMLEALDPNSSYLSPAAYSEYQKTHTTEATLGIIPSKRFGFVNIVALLPDGPAEKAGLQTGDMIESIDGVGTRNMSVVEVNSLMEGASGSTVTLAIVRERATEPVPMEIQRQVMPTQEVAGRIISPDIGYLQVSAFPKGQTQKIAERIRDLQRTGAKKFILDLRNNAIGDPSEGVATANLFLGEGLIGYAEGQQYKRESFLADASKALVADAPLTVLVDESTGGPAEIIAGAILDTHRGQVVGARTFGIGAIQKVIPMDDGSALVLSVAKYYTPSGKAIQETGVEPDVAVEVERELVPLPKPGEAPEIQAPKPGGDAPLNRAIELLKSPPDAVKAAA